VIKYIIKLLIPAAPDCCNYNVTQEMLTVHRTFSSQAECSLTVTRDALRHSANMRGKCNCGFKSKSYSHWYESESG